MVKYGMLSAKQKKMLVKYFITHPENHVTDNLNYEDSKLSEIFDERPSEYFYVAVDHIVEDWQNELTHGGKLHTATIDSNGNGEMEHYKQGELECDHDDFDVCDLKTSID
jgi:hypothetical protein